jgi:hypothetical protein
MRWYDGDLFSRIKERHSAVPDESIKQDLHNSLEAITIQCISQLHALPKQTLDDFILDLRQRNIEERPALNKVKMDMTKINKYD